MQSASISVLFTGVHVYLTGILCGLQASLSCLQVCMYNIYISDRYSVQSASTAVVYRCACISDRYSVRSASAAVLFTGVHVYLTGIL